MLPAKAEVNSTQGTALTPLRFIGLGKEDGFSARVGGAYLSLAGVSVTLNIADNTS
ncbi:MAG: hypothetical protein VB814_02315 [Pirellulaceae bacterium]